MASARNYKPGDVVHVVLDEARGRGKPRWMVVLSSLQLEGNNPYYLCVAISTTFPEPPPAMNVPLPWHPQGVASTGLRKRSAAILDWVRKMPPELIIRREGYIKSALLREIFRLLEGAEDSKSQSGGASN